MRLGRAAGLSAIVAVLAVGLVAPATSAADSSYRAASSDGSKVFFSTDEQLVSGDTDGGHDDIYERSAGATNLISRGQINGNGAFYTSYDDASIDGSKVFFYTEERLVGADTDDSGDVYERSGGTTKLVSQGQTNGNGAFPAYPAGASNDGSKVFFYSYEQLASDDTDNTRDIYQRSGGATTRVSQGEVNGNGAFGAYVPIEISEDGTRVFFYTEEQLASGDTDSSLDLYERSGGATTRVSQGEVNGNGPFDVQWEIDFVEVVSSDGSKAFFSTDEQLVAGDTDTSADVYERSEGTTKLVSQGPDGNHAYYAGLADTSDDGSKAFFVTGGQLVSGDTDNETDIYERSGGLTIQVTQGQINGNGNFYPRFAGASGDGSKVFFSTYEQLVEGDTDTSQDLYERSGGTTTWVSQGQINGNGLPHAAFAGASGDGSKVFFSTSEKLVSGDTDSSLDLYERSGGTTKLVSRGPINGNGAFDVDNRIGASSDGTKVFFQTDERLVGADKDGDQDVYERSGGATKLVSVDTALPNTTIGSGPSGGTNHPTPTFTFSSSEPVASFECKLDAGTYGHCSSPKTLSHLADGSHAFYVRAKDSAGNDPTPAVRTFTVRTAEVRVSGSTLVITAASGANDNLEVFRASPSTLRVTDEPTVGHDVPTGSGVHTGARCTRSGDYTANCSASGITQIDVVAGDGEDTVWNSTAIKSTLHGGAANDVLIGGWVYDVLIGASGHDRMEGRSGWDDLRARDLISDWTIDCGDGTADRADLDLLPKDPNAAVIGCERNTRH